MSERAIHDPADWIPPTSLDAEVEAISRHLPDNATLHICIDSSGASVKIETYNSIRQAEPRVYRPSPDGDPGLPAAIADVLEQLNEPPPSRSKPPQSQLLRVVPKIYPFAMLTFVDGTHVIEAVPEGTSWADYAEQTRTKYQQDV